VNVGELRRLAGESWPLLVNALLVNLFFRVDVFIVQAARGDAALGIYDAAYKLINLLTIVPAYVTLAVFPLLSRRSNDPLALSRAAGTTIYLLVTLAFAAVAGISALAGVTIRVLAGESYLPEGALLLRILIWFAPLSFANGVIQYVLVAVGRQRRLVPAFVAAVGFNVLANLIFVPIYGARAAAVTTVLTEVVILLSFAVVARDLVLDTLARPLVRRLWRPCVTGCAAAAVALILRDQPILAAGGALLTLVALGWAIGVIGVTERQLLRRALPTKEALRPTRS
jgi:O-antigen/teichoic acid export membrane protein